MPRPFAVFTIHVFDAFPNGGDERGENLCDALDESLILEGAVEALESELRAKFGNHISVRMAD